MESVKGNSGREEWYRVCGSERERMDVGDWERRDKVNCQFYSLVKKRKGISKSLELETETLWKKRDVVVWWWGGGVYKSDNIRKRKANGGVERPVLLPVPCALRGDPGQVWGMWSMTGGTKPTTVPQREALFWARGVQEVSRLNVWMDGWRADRLSGWMLVPPSGRLVVLLAHRAGM